MSSCFAIFLYAALLTLSPDSFCVLLYGSSFYPCKMGASSCTYGEVLVVCR